MLDQLRKGDTVVVWKFDCLLQLLTYVLLVMEWIAVSGAGFRSVTEHTDTTTPAVRGWSALPSSSAP